jgi:hypothetical protein
MGVRLMNLAAGDSVVALALNAESLAEADPADEDADPGEVAGEEDPAAPEAGSDDE